MYRDRADGGAHLARRLAPGYQGRGGLLVLALPRGGVPVALPVALALEAPLDVFTVRKLGVPGQEELAMGALARGGTRVLNDAVVHALRIPESAIEAVAVAEQRELERRERAYRGDRPYPEIAGRTVIVVDDGLATGSSMRAAVRALRQAAPARVVVGVPVGAPESCEELRDDADEVVCALSPPGFRAVGEWYRDFRQTTDQEVREALASAAQRQPTRH
jgi:putative phosphoribosyl transferase